MDQLLQQLKDRIHNQKFFTARGLACLSRQTNMTPEVLAQGLAAVTALILEFSDGAFFVANGLLVAYPTIATYVFPEERPSRDQLLVYWSCFGLLTCFDRVLQAVPLYYSFKVCLLALFFLEPFSLAERISKLIETKLEEHNLLTPSELRRICRRTGRSPVPNKPVDPYPPSPSAETAVQSTPAPEPQMNTARLSVVGEPEMKTARLPVVEPPPPVPEPEMKTARLPVADPPKEVQPAAEPAPEPQMTTARLPVVEEPQPTAAAPPKENDGSVSLVPPGTATAVSSTPNPMETNSWYRLHSEGPGTDNKEIGTAANINDLLLWPHDAVVFNAPFDFDNLTYHMTVQNGSKHQMAFAIKGNCIPRVTANPPHALLAPGEKMVVAVTVRKFKWNDVDFAKDRICFEYVLLKEEQRTGEFSHKLLQHSDYRRRKNIRIVYNP